MIAATRTQNIIIVSMIIIGLVAGVSLYRSASYYTGSYAMVKYLDVSLESVIVSNLDPTNQSVDPRLSMVFRFTTPQTLDGEAYLTFLTAKVWLNNESITYSAFRLNIPSEHQPLTPNYNATFTLTSVITDMNDKVVFFNASSDNKWTFSIRLTVAYHAFKSNIDSFRILMFAHEGVTFE